MTLHVLDKHNHTVIEEVTTYTYLGIKFFGKHVGELKDKGRKCLFSLVTKNKEWRDLGPILFLYLFDKTVNAVLGYGGQIWGLRDWEELERIHLLAWKHILNVKTNTTIDAIYAELARNPLIASRHMYHQLNLHSD